MSVGPWQIAIIALVILLLFGASRLGDIGKGLGEGIKNFKKGIAEDEDDAPKKSASSPKQLKHVEASEDTESEGAPRRKTPEGCLGSQFSLSIMSTTAQSVVSEPQSSGLVAPLIQLSKPGVTRLVMVTAVCGALVAPQRIDTLNLLIALCSTALVVAGANALNMFLERDVDAKMERTRLRPIPSGRTSPETAFWFGICVSAMGIALLLTLVNLVAATLAGLALLSYVLVYTPLKRSTRYAPACWCPTRSHSAAHRLRSRGRPDRYCRVFAVSDSAGLAAAAFHGHRHLSMRGLPGGWLAGVSGRGWPGPDQACDWFLLGGALGRQLGALFLGRCWAPIRNYRGPERVGLPRLGNLRLTHEGDGCLGALALSPLDAASGPAVRRICGERYVTSDRNDVDVALQT
jgi:TatA/E family protein of Tat protein translocase